MNVINALTIDFEEWFCVHNFSSKISFSDWESKELRITKNIVILLELLEKYNVKATFFVLGWLAEKVPELIRIIDSKGHEIASHGYSHISLSKMTENDFRKDLEKALSVKQKITGKKIIGFRCPSFSLTPKTKWAFDIMIENGLIYDSSVFPTNLHPEYGYPGVPGRIFRAKDELFEIPLNTADFWGLKLPFGGGGYFRLYPYKFTEYLIKRKNKTGEPVVFYAHPWEFDEGQPRFNAGYYRNFRHYYNIKNNLKKFERLLESFRFTSIKDLYFNGSSYSDKMNKLS